MKYILIFLFALLCSVGYAQNPVSQYLGAPTTLVISRGGLKADSSLILPQFPDTTAANRSPYIKFYPGNLIRVYNDIYVRNTTATKWNLVNGGGTGGNNYIDSLKKVGDSVFAKKYGVFVFQYIDSSQLILANNGLSFSGDTLQLGGTLTKNTTINGKDKLFKIDSLYVGTVRAVSDSGSIASVQTFAGYAEDVGELSNAQLYATKYGKNSYINVNSDSIFINTSDSIINVPKIKTNADTSGKFPLMYNPNTSRLETYTGGFGNLGIDTTSLSNRINQRVKYTDTASMLSPYINNANNGLTISGQTVQLGGALNQNTTIDGGSSSAYNMTFTNGDFILNKGNGIGGLRGNLIMSNDRGVYWDNTSGVGIGGSSAFNGISYFVPGSGYHYFYGNLNLANYGNGTKTGTPTYNLGVTSLGNVIETPLPTPTDTTSLSNRINERIDSLKRSNDSVYARKNGVFVFQYRDSVGNAGGGGGGGKIYYLNGGVSLGTFGGIPMYELGDTAVIGTAANFTRNTTGNIANFITDVGKPGLLQIPSGVWTIDAFLSETGGGSNHAQIYAVLEKWNGTTLTTIATSPVEEITNGNIPDLYTYSISVPTTTISVTDRIVIQFYIQNTNGKTVTLYTQNGYVGEVHTTFTTGIGSLNGLVTPSQTFATGTSGSDFNIQSVTSTHTFNLPTASATNRGALSSTDWSTFNGKVSPSDTANKWITSVFRKTASDSVFFVRGGTNNFAFRDSTGAAATWLRNANNIFYTGGRVGVYVDTPSAKLTVVDNTITTTVADSSGLVLGNYTPATAGVTQRFSPALTFIGQAWGSTGASNRVNKWRIFNQTLSSGASSSNLIFSNSVNNAAYTDVVTFSSTGLGANTITGTTINATNLFSPNLQGTGTGSISIDANTDKTTGTLNIRGATTVLEAISGTPTVQASSILTLNSTARGFLQPRMTTSQMNAISTPATGLSVFNTTDSLPYVYRGTSSGWQKNVTYTRTNDIGLLNGADQRLMIEPTTNIVVGRSLTVEAGSTQAGGTSAFQPLSQTTRRWTGMASAPNGDIYASVQNGDIYKRTGGIGNFTALSQVSRVWQAMAAASNGDIYAVVYGGDIYKQTGGTGNFVGLGQTSRNWTGISVASNGDIYATVFGGDIYKSVGGGAFTALGQTSRNWYGVTVASNGDVYACVFNGDIWRSTNGGTTFSALSQSSRQWYGLASSSSGDIYAVVNGGDIYKQTGGTGNFIGLSQTSRAWSGITLNSNGDIYASVDNGDIYLQSAGTANLNGGTLVLQSGVGKGTGTSTINFNTGTTLSSGATLQTASTKMTILGNGNVGIGTTSPSAKLELSDTARGFLQTRMTTTQMNAIVSPSVGLQVFNTTDSSNYVYRGSGGGWQRLATGSVSSVTQQTYTSGASVTCNDNTTWLIIDPASLQSTLTVNLPSSPSPNQDVLISFGGTLTTGVVVNTLTISPTPLQATTPSFIEVGESVGYRWNATNSKWYRIN